MKNFKFLSLAAVLSILAVPSIADITYQESGSGVSQDYAEASDNVSATVDLEFTLAKKVAIAVKDSDGSFTSNALFAGIASSVANSSLATNLDVTPDATLTALSNSVLTVNGAFHTNSDINITIAGGDFVHETDNTSIIDAWRDAEPIFNQGDGFALDLGQDSDTDSAAVSPFAGAGKTTAITAANMATVDNVLRWKVDNRIYLNTVDATDRAGKYLSTLTVTITSQ